MSDGTMEQGTLVVAWTGPALPIEILSREPADRNEPPLCIDGVTGRSITLPPGEYLVRASLPAWTGLQPVAVTIPVRIMAGEDARNDLSSAIIARLANLGIEAKLPIGDGSMFIRPSSAGGPAQTKVDVGFTHPSGLGVAVTIDPGIAATHGADLAGRAWSTLSSAEWLGSVSVLSSNLVRNGASVIAGLPPNTTAGPSGTGASISASLAPAPTAPPAEPQIDAPAPGATFRSQRFDTGPGLLADKWQGRPILGIVPVDRTGGTVATFSANPKAEPGTLPHLGLTFDDPDLDTLWLFMRDAALRESRRLAGSVPGGDGWLSGALGVLTRSPLTATLAAYVLLRANWRENLHDFTAQAIAGDPGLVDLRVIHAEVLGRMGRHDEATAALAELGRGAQPWPLFRPGMAYALARTELYLEQDADEASLPVAAHVHADLSDVAVRLRALCAAMDPSQVPLVLTGSSAERLLQRRVP